MSSSQCRQKFHEKCEEAINRQINMELYASYVYLSMVICSPFNTKKKLHIPGLGVPTFQAYYFDRDDIALPGMYWYFKKASDEERELAMKFMRYLNKRGGRIVLTDIKTPEKKDWGTAQDAMTAALDLEKKVNEVHDFLMLKVMVSQRIVLLTEPFGDSC